MSKCIACNDESLSYYGNEVFCAECNDECESRLGEVGILSEQEISVIRLYGNLIPNAKELIERHNKALEVKDEIN